MLIYMQEHLLMFEEAAGYLSTFEHLIEKGDNESVELSQIPWKYEKRERGKDLGRAGWKWSCQQDAR